jgi:hypothetical protein
LCTKLANRFGKERVFIDVDGIDPGADFVAVIDDALSKCGRPVNIQPRGSCLVGTVGVSITG